MFENELEPPVDLFSQEKKGNWKWDEKLRKIRYVVDDEVSPYGADKQSTEPPVEETSKFGQRVGTAHFNPAADN